MHKNIRIILNFLSENLMMPREFKYELINKNLKTLIKLTPFLLIFSATLFLIKSITNINNHLDITFELMYYLSIFLLSLVTLILSIIFLRTDNILYPLYNAPLLVIFLGMSALCYVTFYTGTNPFNSLIIFVCIATMLPLVFAIEPLFYIPIMILCCSLMAPKINTLYGFGSVMNSFLYIFIVCTLGLKRWISIKKSMMHDKLYKDHEMHLQQELEMAALVQKSFYQHDLTSIRQWDIVYYNDPMISLSGDLFDFFTRQDILSGLCIFDVSGHGLSSGLVTMMVKNTMEEEFYENEDLELSYTMHRINKRVREEKGNIENYLTGIILRFKNDTIEMVNAGHPTPIIYNSSTRLCEYYKCDVKDRQGAIGLADLDFDFTTLEINIDAEDRIVLYTDGITESKNEEQEEYGKDRFIASVQKHSNLSIEDQMNAIISDVKEFIGNAPRTDDISLVILKKN